MTDVTSDALQKFYKNECKFTQYSTVVVYLHGGERTFLNVQMFRILILSGEKILVIETEDEKHVFHQWLGVCLKKRKETEFQVG